MRVGFVTQLLWDRYGGFWHQLVEEAGAEARFASTEALEASLGDPRLAAVPGLAFRRAVAQALALHDCDALVAPSLNGGSEASRGGGQDPWIADFPGALATIAGLPRVIPVPSWLEPVHESLVVEVLQSLTHDPGTVRRLLDRRRSGLRPAAIKEPRWSVLPSQTATVGVVGQPWLVGAATVARVAEADEHAVGQHQLDPERLREEGGRVDGELLPTDREALGAARLFGRRGAVTRIRVLVDPTSGSDAWLLGRIRKLVRKPLIVHEVSAALVAEAAGPLREGEEPA